MIGKLPLTNDALWQEYQAAMHDMDCLRKLVRASGMYPLTSSGRNNSYSLFAERLTALVSNDGRIGAVLPTGIATDDTNKAFFGTLVLGGVLESLISFYEIRLIFQGTDSRQPFCLLTLRGRNSNPTEAATFYFSLKSTEDIQQAERRFQLTIKDFQLLNPNTKTCPLFRTQADAELTKSIYRRVPVLVNEGAGENPWGVTFKQGIFNMSTDSHLFRTREQMEGEEFQLSGNHFVKGDELWLPLYEAKMIQQFDHRYGTYQGQSSRTSVELPTPTEEEHRSTTFYALPWYWVSAAEFDDSRLWTIGYRGITNATSERTCIFSIVPRAAVGNSCSLIRSSESATLCVCLLANFCSIVCDYVAKQKVGGNNFNFFYLKQFPILPPSRYSSVDFAFIVPRVLELVASAWDVQPFLEDVWSEADEGLRRAIWRQWTENRDSASWNTQGPPTWHSVVPGGFPGGPFKWQPERRERLQAELHAYFAKLYGLSIQDIGYILDPEDVYGATFPGETFRVLKAAEIERHQEYRTKRLVRDAWARLERGDL